MNKVHEDRSDISQLILHWGYYRDHALWDELRETFHSDGEIRVTWYVGKFDGFVDASQEMTERGAKSFHVMGPSIIDLQGDRAIAITPVSILGRARLALGVEVDMTSEAQFFDFVERRSGRWRILRRICIYQKDRMDSVGPSLRFWLMSRLMPTDRFDPAYRYLGMALSKAGYPVQPGQVVDNTQTSRDLYAQGQRWLQSANESIQKMCVEGDHETVGKM